MEDYRNSLNAQQLEAVTYMDGPQLVIAGAGSGKTRVLTYKIVHLLAKGYEPWRIMALTFTNKAAKEMRERIQSIVGPAIASKLWMGTFHSIFARILRLHADRIGFKSNFTIYDVSDSRSLIKTIIKDMDLDEKVYNPNTIANAISSAKNALISPDRYALDRDIMEADKRSKRPLTHAIYKGYMDRCFVAGAMDFDDLLYFTNVLLRDNPDILRHYQAYFRFVLIDEYQDTNFAQHLIATQLCDASQNICAVGDDAQSIYSFRGANIRNILNLKRSYPTLKIFKLEENYRSTQNIINAANSLIAKNKEQIPKNIFSNNDVGRKIEVINCYSDYEEATVVAQKISAMKMNGHDSYEEFAILYRTNVQSRRLEEALRNRNIPYRIYGGLSFYQRKEVKDAIAYFRLTVNPDDDEAIKRIINYPARGIGETTVNKLMRCAIDNQVSIWHVIDNLSDYQLGINSGTMKKLLGFRDLMSGFISQANLVPADEIVNNIIRDTNLVSCLISDKTPESISKQENLTELNAVVHEFVETRLNEGAEYVYLSDFLGNVSLATDQDSDDTPTESVTLMTVHAAKGLEFKNVIIVGVEEELFPSSMSSDTLQQIEEERRLLYVAITRAKTNCIMTYASSRYKNGQNKTCQPSRFIKDIDSKFLRLAPGVDIPSTSARVNPLDNYRSSQRIYEMPSYNKIGLSKNTKTSGYPHLESKTTPPVDAKKSGNNIGCDIHDASALSVGMRIVHSTFGHGTISNIFRGANDAITVKFDNVGDKKLLLKFARFKIEDQ